MLSIIVAISKNNIIGKEGKLPWYLPNDLKRFREVTTGHKIIMGRKTYESLPKILPNRQHIVLTRDKNFNVEDERVTIIYSVEELLKALSKNEEYFVIGGAEIFSAFEEYVDRIYLTVIQENFEGDVAFPKIDYSQWKEVSCENGIVDEKNKYAHKFLTLDRIK
jgi:dihydrofolate reductase